MIQQNNESSNEKMLNRPVISSPQDAASHGTWQDCRCGTARNRNNGGYWRIMSLILWSSHAGEGEGNGAAKPFSFSNAAAASPGTFSFKPPEGGFPSVQSIFGSSGGADKQNGGANPAADWALNDNDSLFNGNPHLYHLAEVPSIKHTSAGFEFGPS